VRTLPTRSGKKDGRFWRPLRGPGRSNGLRETETLDLLVTDSERRACSIVGADRKMIRYRSRTPAESELRARLRALDNERRRFGCRRLFVFLRQDGEPSGINRIYRLYREEGLTVRRRRARRRAMGSRAPILVETAANARPWISSMTNSPAAGDSASSTSSTT
jgi:HTH-like domain